VGEILFVILLVAGMVGSGIWVGLKTKYWHLLWVFLTFFGCFGFWEWHATTYTDLSVSQQVWEFGKSVPSWQFWLFIGSLIVSWLALMYHFSSKKLKKGE